MSLLTRTGLLSLNSPLTSSPSKERQLNKFPNLNLDNFIVPAPFVKRLSIQSLINNYPFLNSCSIFCNHPILDTNTKKLLMKAKEGLKKKGKLIVQTSELNSEYPEECIRLNEFEDTDPIFLPEVLFLKYTQTDSRPPTPTVVVSPIIFPNIYRSQSIIEKSSRRCIMADDNRFLNAPTKNRQLVIDIREGLNQSHLTLEGIKMEKNRAIDAIFQCEINRNKFSNKNKSYRNGKLAIKNTKKRNTLVSSELIKYNSFSKRKIKNAVETNKLIHNIDRSTPLNVLSINLQKSETRRIPKLKTSKKKKGNFKTKNRETDNMKNLEDTETQISKRPDYSENGREENKTESLNHEEGNISYDYDLYYEDIHTMLLERGFESLLDDPNPLKYWSLANYISTTGSINNTEIDSLGCKRGFHTGDRRNQQSQSLNHIQMNSERKIIEIQAQLSRILSRKNARFELPIDKTRLIGLNVRKYLKSFVHISNASRVTYYKIFRTFAKNKEKNALIGNNDTIQDNTALVSALVLTMGKNFDENKHKEIIELLDLQNNNQLDIDLLTWYGISAFCERIYAEQLSFKYLSKVDDPCDEIEEADFQYLEFILIDLPIEEKLRKALFLIKDS